MMDYDEKHWSRPCPKADCRKKACECGLLYKTIPAALGDDSPTSAVAPKNGAYCNSIVEYEANGHIYLYGSDGIPVEIGGEGGGGVSDFDALLNRPKYAGEEMTSETDIPDVAAAVEAEATARASADTALGARIDDITSDLATETSLRQDADSDLRDRIDVVVSDLTDETTARQTADTALQGNITALADRVTTAESDIDSIEEVIPAQASAQNQLADKNFVNSSVATNTANYISNNGQPFSSVAELEAYSGTLTNNDYAFVTGTDAQGNTFYDRYKYNANTGEWAFEYELNNSSFTANQWAAINSGITSGDVTKLSNLANIQTIGANLSLTNGELSATDTTYTAGTGIDITNGVISATSTGPTVVQTTGTSTTDVMSQNATTSMVFADPSTRQRICIGNGAASIGIGSVALGASSTATARGSVAIGYGTPVHDNGVVNIGPTGNSYYGYRNTEYRLLTGLYAPQSAHDAANKEYVDNLAISYATLNGASAPTMATVGTYVGQLYLDTTNDQMYYLASIDDTADPVEYNWAEIGGGPNVVQTTGTSTTDVMSQNAVTSMVYADPSSCYKVRIGALATASGNEAVRVGAGGSATGAQAVSVGSSSVASGQNSVCVGYSSTVSGTADIGIGQQSKLNGRGSVAIGAYSGPGTTAGGTGTGIVYFNSRETSYGYNSSNYRLLTGLYDPQNAHDAANKQYVDTAVAGAGAEEITSEDWSALWQ